MAYQGCADDLSMYVPESVGSVVVWRIEMTGDPMQVSYLQEDRMEAGVAGLESCTRHVGSRARNKTGEINARGLKASCSWKLLEKREGGAKKCSKFISSGTKGR